MLSDVRIVILYNFVADEVSSLRGIIMLVKAIIILFFIVIIYSLGSGLFYLVKDKGEETRVVKALTWRISLSLLLFILLLIAYGIGWINPHGI